MDSSGPRLVASPLLADAATYTPGTFDLLAARPEGHSRPNYPDVQAWLQVFRHSAPTFHAHACLDTTIADVQKRRAAADAFVAAFEAILDALAEDPAAEVAGHTQPLTCISLCVARDAALHAAGFTDIFKQVNDQENKVALALLPGVLAELDAVADVDARLQLAVAGVLSGNIFDLGAAASANRFAEGGSSFAATRDQLVSRPWVIDHMDPLLERLQQHPPYRKALLFVDNAGCDVVLGMLPFARELVKLGTQVIIAANECPTINDITAAELQPLLATAASSDAFLHAAVAEHRIAVMSSGSALPVLDLRQVSSELVAECADVDLLVLEGMGRSIETNLHARFKVDSLKIGMVKHPEVAACLGGRLYDCVIKFDRAST